ncbi:hypothetical protein SAMN02745245_01102 [Anaerosphaera aminiphila DSM 21120]|uniref:GIY-YIG domain-containing protein n=1 Tax=Anaerosphaera aminiphila DSM 21120 TaxID=1120995 RepID=A0A1M5S417_9FIRM|nr:hypothetical protein [Anaerosphaera aminiphila]SHH33028.1 hypothetical protein SAMN02745245_01102 [Anaerosphaera aminiphila DSM 21120]
MNIKNREKEIEEIVNGVFKIIDKDNIDEIKYDVISRGCPHEPKGLPKNKMGIYMFIYGDRFLKIGRVGNKSNARFVSQHYNPNSSKSNLAKSILKDEDMKDFNLDEKSVGKWIKDECFRIDILVDDSLGIRALSVIESILQYKYKPIYEGFKSQR